MPMLLFHEFHLLLPTKSTIDGLGVLQSPIVACLYKP
jgi:hypothetical protein